MKRTALVERLLAWGEGKPAPHGDAISWPRVEDDERLVIAFVKMGGESMPWGVAVGQPGAKPAVYALAEPTNRDQHHAFVLAWGERLLRLLAHPVYETESFRTSVLEAKKPQVPAARRRQLWVAGGSHLDILHALEYRYARLKGDGEEARRARMFGRACGWLFRESNRPGQVRVFNATERLREAYAFPSESPRQAHLGFLLAWLAKDETKEGRMARAHDAEALSVSASLDPDFERDAMQPLLERWNARRAGSDEAAMRAAIAERLRPELLRRWELTVTAIRQLDGDPRPDNSEVADLVEYGAYEYYSQYWRKEAQNLDPALPDEERAKLTSNPETDRSTRTAASRYDAHKRSHEMANAALAHGDASLLAALVDEGNGFRGVIRSVDIDGPTKGSPKVWTVECPSAGPLRLREDSKICQAFVRKRKAVVRSVVTAGAVRTITLEITEGKTKKACPGEPDADDAGALEGRVVTFVVDGNGGFPRSSISVPGAWLFDAKAPPEPHGRPRSSAGASTGNLVDLVEALG